MRKKLLLLVMAGVVLAGCETFPEVADIKECEGSNGHDIKIRYGDSKIEVTNKVTVKQDEKLVIKFQPDNSSDEGRNYGTLDIFLIGKEAKDKWLNRKVNSNDENNKKAIICIGDQKAGTYSYMVVVPGVGQIDPRVDVQDKQ
jgi:hypothetical protein